MTKNLSSLTLRKLTKYNDQCNLMPIFIIGSYYAIYALNSGSFILPFGIITF